MGRKVRPMPPDFLDHATEGINALMKRYHAANTVVIRWKELCGTLRQYRHLHPISIDTETGERRRYESVNDAAREIYGDRSNIYNAIRSGKKAYGCIWIAETDE